MYDDEDYLAHHGIKGQHWGIRRTPEQLGHKPVKKRENKIKKLVDEAAKKKKAIKEKSADEQREELKQYLRKHPFKMASLGKELSKAEVDEITSGIEFDRRLKDIRRDEIQRGFRTVNDIKTDVKAVLDLAQVGKDAYNTTADIYNTFVEAGVAKGPKMIKVGGGKPEGDRSAIKKLIKEGSPDDVYANLNKMTTAEQKDALERMRNAQNIYGYTEAGKSEKKKQNESSKKQSSSDKDGSVPDSINDVANQHARELAEQGRWDDLKEFYPDVAKQIFAAMNNQRT